MINIPLIPVSTKIRTELIPDVTKTWKVGQLLNATAERNVNANDIVLMRMGNTILEAKTPIALKSGDPLKLLVKSLGDKPVLTIQTSLAPPQIAAQNLKSFIGQQQDLTGLLALSQNVIANPAISRMLKQQILDLHQGLPDAEQVTQAQTLKKLIQNSGIFLESKLNSLQTDSLGQDTKSQLLRIKAQLQEAVPGLLVKPQLTTANNLQSIINAFLQGSVDPVQLSILLTNRLSKGQRQIMIQALTTAGRAPVPKILLDNFTLILNHIQQQDNPQKLREILSSLLETMGLLQELKSRTDGALAKVTSQQLMPLTREADSLLLLFDLYFKDKTENHLINFRLEQEKSAEEQGASGWAITLNFDFRELGPVQAQLHLTDNNIYTLFRAERISTAERLSGEMNLLQTAFNNIGFDAINLAVAQGGISQPNDLAKGVRLLDEKA